MKNVCEETHVFKPFSNGDNGAKTTIDISLEFMEEKSVDKFSTLQFTSKDVLSFSHDHRRTNDDPNEAHVIQLLQRHPSATTSDIPVLFDALVYGLRSLHHSQLVNVYYSLRNPRTIKFFQDALPLLKTDAGVTLMRDIINSGQIDSAIIDSWFSSLAFYKNPTRGMLIVLSTLVNENSRSSALLGISGLAGTFCSNNKNCFEIAEMKQILTNFEKLLGNSCESSSPEQELQIVLVLKSLRNIGHLQNSKNVLTKCATTKTNSLLIRVSVMETIRRWELSCSFDQSKLITILRDVQEDSELRINAYLALMTCPSDKSIEAIKGRF